MLVKRVVQISVLAIAVAVTAAVNATAQSYPTRPITIIVPFPPGGNSDLVIRHLADRLSVSLNQPVIVENRAGGAGGTVGTRAFASANPDGYTLLFIPPAPLVTAPLIYKNLGYDPVRSFAPVAMVFSIPQMLVINPTLPVKSMEQLVSHAKANPGKISFATPGFGTQPHLLGEMFRLMTDINIVHVPYKGPAQAVTDLLAGQVQMYFDTVALFLPHIEAGKLTALAVADERRSPQLPAVPTTTESGFPTLQSTFWAGIIAPIGTPASIVGKLNVTINEILKSPELEASLAKINAKPKVGSPEDFAMFMAAETQKWTKVINSAGIRAD
jgi:tripartite-type tricarboxylate transporter receptor subunit TctC